MRLIDIPHKEFPLTVKKYSKVEDILRAAMYGFEHHGYKDIADELLKSLESLNNAWSMIRDRERLEMAEEADD